MDMEMPTNEPWPPAPPNLDFASIEFETPPLAVSANSQIYKIKGRPSEVFKSGALYREYQLQKAAGDCAIPVRGKVLGKPPICQGATFYGFMMDLASPIPKAPPPSQRRDIMHQMIRVVQNLHGKHIVHGDMKLDNMLLDTQGNVRLCDFAEGRSMSEPEGVWEGMTTWHYESPNRRRRGEQLGRDTLPPIIEDDLFGLGLSIWQLFTGRVPHGDMVQDDIGLREKQLRGETVDVTEVDDREARDVITGLLRQGGARIQHGWWTTSLREFRNERAGVCFGHGGLGECATTGIGLRCGRYCIISTSCHN
jgi:hypothetical protein